jgi:hypothetical protein
LPALALKRKPPRKSKAAKAFVETLEQKIDRILQRLDDLISKQPVIVNVAQSQSQIQDVMDAVANSGLAPAPPKATTGNAPLALNATVGSADPNKGKFGGNFFEGGWLFSATVTAIAESTAGVAHEFRLVKLRVAKVDTAAQENTTATFILHPSFAKREVQVPINDGVATLSVVARGAFTAGCELQPTGVLLELDLSSGAVDADKSWQSR